MAKYHRTDQNKGEYRKSRKEFNRNLNISEQDEETLAQNGDGWNSIILSVSVMCLGGLAILKPKTKMVDGYPIINSFQ